MKKSIYMRLLQAPLPMRAPVRRMSIRRWEAVRWEFCTDDNLLYDSSIALKAHLWAIRKIGGFFVKASQSVSKTIW